MPLPSLEDDLKSKNLYMQEVLRDTLELFTLILGNLECVIEIRKRTNLGRKKETRILKKNFAILEDIMEQYRSIIKQSQEISYDFVKPIPPKEVKKQEEFKPPNNIIIFPLGQEDDDIYVRPGETVFDWVKNKKEEKKDE